MSKVLSSGIQTSADGQAFIPSSKRADGTTRKEIRIRPGYKPAEDVEKYKSRNVEAWRSRDASGVPGADTAADDKHEVEGKSKNAKRREAARRKKELESEQALDDVQESVANLQVNGNDQIARELGSHVDDQEQDMDAERQKKIRNQLKKLKAVKELKAKKAAGEKLTADQLIKISKEGELMKDLTKLHYEGPELEESQAAEATQNQAD
ncbi:hypothetical protein H2198_003448 [Neophaeococcomyces mojaviensis]|uniref:Uncharacterized protein n=1 Tax=Neophaeococcomyces mojaviensis TaxID=3383035 RepID=A0ACC3ABI2_9EURO|nr:hypothetical protein H2198_003448 [Knufia sp. JES_112]